MIDLTPLDVRKKHEDFNKILRGFDPQEVQTFLEMVAERMEELVRENLALRERTSGLEQQVSSQTGREQAVQDALVTAQELRGDIQRQAQKEAEFVVTDAHTEARRMMAEAEAEVRSLMRDAQRKLDQGVDALEEMERRRVRFLRAFRQLLERELDVVEVEEARAPLEDRAIDLDLGGGKTQEPAVVEESSAAPPASPDTPAAPVPDADVTDGFTSTAVDESAAQRPPLEAPIDQLAQTYESADAAETLPADPGSGAGDGAGGSRGMDPVADWEAFKRDASGKGEESEDPTLFNSLESEDSDDDGRWG